MKWYQMRWAQKYWGKEARERYQLFRILRNLAFVLAIVLGCSEGDNEPITPEEPVRLLGIAIINTAKERSR